MVRWREASRREGRRASARGEEQLSQKHLATVRTSAGTASATASLLRAASTLDASQRPARRPDASANFARVACGAPLPEPLLVGDGPGQRRPRASANSRSGAPPSRPAAASLRALAGPSDPLSAWTWPASRVAVRHNKHEVGSDKHNHGVCRGRAARTDAVCTPNPAPGRQESIRLGWMRANYWVWQQTAL